MNTKWLAALLLTVIPWQASATSLLQLSFEELVNNSALIFEGRVIDLEARQTGPRSIHTFVTFEILDIIKGDYRASTIELSYLGGRVGDIELTVSEMQFPAMGETGIYFVENPAEEFIHPLVGWSQGHYLIRQLDNLRQEVTTAEGQAVVGVEETSTTAMPMLLEHGDTVRGLRIQALTAPAAAMTPAAFKDKVRLVDQQTHNRVEAQP